ncbi:hypothetical protein [Actinokineospora enzanensis]|uniref:hypothetical protein n=1 Tax=Actinokineospora enzanensis TaxID=155975 RepID=UPI0004770B2F|nr:hypothetical protein [Actinokineospora enzanensis]
MTFRWRYEDESGGSVVGPDIVFADRDEAEAWFADTWPDLLESGVERVVLVDGDTEVYGPMSLRP